VAQTQLLILLACIAVGSFPKVRGIMDDNLLGFTDAATAQATVQPSLDYVDTQGPAAPVGPSTFMAGMMPTHDAQQTTEAPLMAAGNQYMDPFQGVPVPADSSQVSSIKPIPEMNKLREWEDNHERQLEEFTRSEEDKKKQQRQAASEELRRWYEERTTATQKRLETNRADAEAAAKAKDDGQKTLENPWAKVSELIDTSARTSDEARDTSRMRSILIQLKTSPVPCAA